MLKFQAGIDKKIGNPLVTRVAWDFHTVPLIVKTLSRDPVELFNISWKLLYSPIKHRSRFNYTAKYLFL